MSRRAVCEKHKYGSVKGALSDGGPYSTPLAQDIYLALWFAERLTLDSDGVATMA